MPATNALAVSVVQYVAEVGLVELQAAGYLAKLLVPSGVVFGDPVRLRYIASTLTAQANTGNDECIRAVGLLASHSLPNTALCEDWIVDQALNAKQVSRFSQWQMQGSASTTQVMMSPG